MTNKDVARCLRELAELLEISGENRFRVGAYYNGARKLMDYPGDIKTLAEEDRLDEIQGIGKGIASLIKETLAEGYCPALEEIKNELPAGLLELVNVPGIGPRRAHQFFYDLGIQNLSELKKALVEGKVRQLKGMGPKTEKKLLDSLKKYESYQDVIILLQALIYCEELTGELQEDEDITSMEVVGGIRRRKELVRDIDLLIAASKKERLLERIKNLETIKEITGEKQNEITAENINNFPVKITIVSPEEFSAARVYHTGSKEHVQRLKTQAEKLGYKLTPTGLYREGKLQKIKDEREFYQSLQLDYIIPEMREDNGEIEAASGGELPEIITLKDIKGDLHMHSRYSDGAHTIEEMVEAAREKGYQYIAITDHSKSLKVAHGLSVEDLLAQIEEIDRLQQKYDDFKIFKGIEVDIMSDGSLDYEDEILSRLDLVIASIHTGFNQPGEQITSRIIRAMENRHVKIVAHPQGRILKKRQPYKVDLDQIIKKAAETGTCLEINASPYRLDLDDLSVRRAKEAGVMTAVNTDSHHIDELNDMALGLTVARRGWLEKGDVINAMGTKELSSFLKR